MQKSYYMPIQFKITLLTFGIIAFSVLIGGIFLLGNAVSLKEEEFGKRSMLTAHTIAELPQVKQLIQTPKGWHAMNPIIEKLRTIHTADYIVVLNTEHVRYSHPVHSMLGTISNSSDESAAFAEHEYFSKAKGESGIAIRAFVPILNQDDEQIGVVVVGNIIPTFKEMISTYKNDASSLFLLTLIFGACGSWVLAKHIKRETFHLEPHEISRVLVERTAAFNAMHEGVIAIDNNEKITIFNEKAKQMLGISGDVVGENIQDIISDTRLPEVLHRTTPIFNQEISVQNKNIFSNRVPIKVGEATIGAVAIFQDRTDVTKLAEELTGVKTFVEALRVQNHEHKNKLHTIAGLIQLGELDKALDYVFQISDEQEELTKFLSKRIHDESIAGLLLSKVSHGRELGIDLIFDEETNLQRFPEDMDHHDFVLMLGNLIENSFAALKHATIDEKQVYISIQQDDELCRIVHEDNGIGIPIDNQENIFNYGFTTKGKGGSGIGLYLISQIVERGQGFITLNSVIGEGTTFYLTFPMKKLKEDNHG